MNSLASRRIVGLVASFKKHTLHKGRTAALCAKRDPLVHEERVAPLRDRMGDDAARHRFDFGNAV